MGEMRDGQTAAKIRSDFARAYRTLGVGGMRSWTLLHNHPEARLGPKSVTAINDLKREHEAVNFTVLDIDSLWDLVRKLPRRRLDKLLGEAPGKRRDPSTVDRLLRGQKDTSERVERLLQKLENEQGVPKEALRSILSAFGESNVPDQELIGRLRLKAAEYRMLQKQLHTQSHQAGSQNALLERAYKALQIGDFDASDAALFEVQVKRAQAARKHLPNDDDLLSSEAEVILLRAAIAGIRSEYVRAAALYREGREVVAGDARLERDFRSGEAWSLAHEASQRGDAASAREAVNIYRDLLTGSLDSESKNKLLLELASALVSLNELAPSDPQLEEAIQLYSEFIDVCHDYIDPDQLTNVLNQKAIAQESLGVSKGSEKILHAAVHTYHEALIYSEPHSVAYATIRNNIGNALAEAYFINGRADLLEQATVSFEAGLRSLRPVDEPNLWASINNNLANVLHTTAAASHVSSGMSKQAKVEKLWAAVDGYRKTLQHWTRKSWPVKWATVKMNLANTLHDIGETTEDVDVLTESVRCYEEALSEEAQAGIPLLSARIRHNLAVTLNGLAAMANMPDYYKRAEELETEALGLWPEGARSNDRAHAFVTLGAAIGNNHRAEPGRIRQAVEAFETALSIYKQLQNRTQILDCAVNLAHIYRTLAEYTKDADDLRSAVKWGELATASTSHGVRRCQLQCELSFALFDLGVLCRDQPSLVRSERTLRGVIPVLEEAGCRVDCASAHNKIAASMKVRLSLLAAEEGANTRSLRQLALKAVDALKRAASFHDANTLERAHADAALCQALLVARAFGARKSNLIEAGERVQSALQVFYALSDDFYAAMCEQMLDLLTNEKALQEGR
jgi:hypothetical protein